MNSWDPGMRPLTTTALVGGEVTQAREIEIRYTLHGVAALVTHRMVCLISTGRSRCRCRPDRRPVALGRVLKAHDNLEIRLRRLKCGGTRTR